MAIEVWKMSDEDENVFPRAIIGKTTDVNVDSEAKRKKKKDAE